MPGWNVTVELKEAGKKYCLVSLTGALDAYSFSKFEETLDNLFEGGHRLFIINCHGLAYISSAGLGAMMGFSKKLRDNKGSMTIIHLSAKIYNIMDLLGFTTVFRIFKTEEDAVLSFMEKKDA